MTGQPAFLPPDLISLQELAQEIELGDLGRLLAGGSVRAFYYHDASGFCTLPQQIWFGPSGKEIFDSGLISAEVASQQLGTWTRGNDLNVFISSSDLRPYLKEAVGTPDREEDPSLENEPKNKGGRPPADWDAVFIAAACYLVTNGIPNTQAEFIARLQDQLGAKAPGDTQMKARIGPLYNAVKKALG